MRLYLLVGILLKGCNFLPHCLLIRPSLSGSTRGFLFHCLSHTPCLYHFDAHVFPGSAARSPFRGLPRPLTCPHGSECLFVCFRKAASGALSSSCTFPPSALLSKKPGSFSVAVKSPNLDTRRRTHIWVLDVRLGFPKALAVTGFLFHRKDFAQTTPVVCTEPSIHP